MNDDMDGRLDSLFQAYRRACPDVEGSPTFTPRLWQKIEARRSTPNRLRRWAQVFVSASAGLCLAMSLMMVVPFGSQTGGTGSYLDILDNENSHETMAYAELDDDGDLNQ